MKTTEKQVTTVVTENVATLSDFIKFLEEQKCLTRFIKKFEERGVSIEKYLDWCRTNVESIVSGAFGWDDAMYWGDIQSKWVTFLRKNDIKGFEIE